MQHRFAGDGDLALKPHRRARLGGPAGRLITLPKGEVITFFPAPFPSRLREAAPSVWATAWLRRLGSDQSIDSRGPAPHICGIGIPFASERRGAGVLEIQSSGTCGHPPSNNGIKATDFVWSTVGSPACGGQRGVGRKRLRREVAGGLSLGLSIGPLRSSRPSYAIAWSRRRLASPTSNSVS